MLPPLAQVGPFATEVLVGAGNAGRCEGVTKDEATALLLDNIAGTVFALGDNVRQNGSLQDYNDCYGPSWGRHKARTRPAPGEIEYKTNGAPGYFAYFGAAAGDPTKGYYSYDLGAWHVIVLNSHIAMTAGSAQEQWLRADLTANTRMCTVAYLHYPRFSSIGTGARKEVKPLWAALYDFRADIVMGAHYRAYERFAPQTPDEVADPQGVRQFTVGTGGQGVDKFGAGHRANSVVRGDNIYGVLKLTLGDGTYGWDFVGLPGQTFTDSGTGTCHTRVLVASVAVTPASASVLVGATLQLTGAPLDAGGNPLSGRVVTWSSSNPAIASVNATGLVTAVAGGGPVTITATSEGKSGTSAITVTTVGVASVEVTPAAPTVEAGGDTVRLTAIARDADGNVLPGRVPTWTSSDPAAATVATSGLATGVAPGATTVTATIEGQSGTTDVTVVPATVATVTVTPATASLDVGTGIILHATLKDARGNTLTGRPVVWTSSDEAIAIVESDDGDVDGVAPGTVTITATSEGKSGTAAVTVVPPAVASVDVAPTTATILVGGTVQLTATPKSANGTPLDRPVTWASNNPAAATVDAAGLVTGVGAGAATISATSEGKTGSAVVGVGLVPVATVEVTPATAGVTVGATVQLAAIPKDANGNPLTGRAVAWTRNDAAVGWVDANGLVLGLSPGAVTITATIEGQSGTAAVTVSPPPPGSPVVFVGAGDIASCPLPGDELTADVLDRTAGTVFLAGDDAYEDGTLDEFNTCYGPTWGRHKSRTRPVPGNHEYQTPNGAGYYAYFGAAAGDPTKGYYSFDAGDWHVIVLNPEIESQAGSVQEQWLRADLLANEDKQCTMAIFHEPVFSSSARDGTGGYTVGRAFYQALYEAYADVVVNGHDHVYERFAPQSPTGVLDNVQGIREFVVGTGGASLHGTSSPALPNSEARNGQAWGVLKLTLRAGSYDWEFLPGTGQVYSDAGSGVCHSPAPVPNQPPTARPGGPYASEGAIAFNGSTSTDPDNNLPLTYSWNFGDGNTASGATPTHSYAVDGVYTVTLTVTDSKGLSGDPATTTATVGNIAPTVNAGSDLSALTGGTLMWNASFSDPGADAPWSYTFDWGDGATSTGSASVPGSISATHVYAVAGPYTARVTVTDKDGGAGFDEALVTVSPSSTPQVFIGAGNIAACTNDRDELTAQIIDANPGSTVFALGDNAYPNGTLADYSNCYAPTWGRHKSRTHPTPGNREYVNGSLGAGYFDYWGAAAGERNKGWYSYDVGDWHIVVLNDLVAFGANSEQETWLRADLAASAKLCTLAYWHNPRFFSSTSPGWTSDAARKVLWDDLYARGAEIVLNGQQHQYERLAPMRPDGTPDAATGILSFSVGNGGESAGLPTVIHPQSQTLSAAFGVLKLVLGPGTYSWQYISIPGSTYTDAGSGTCH